RGYGPFYRTLIGVRFPKVIDALRPKPLFQMERLLDEIEAIVDEQLKGRNQDNAKKTLTEVREKLRSGKGNVEVQLDRLKNNAENRKKNVLAEKLEALINLLK